MYAISDLHGMYDIFEQVNNFIKSDNIVYFLGDATDRGPEGWKLMKAIYEHPNWVYLKGNHEDMLYNAYRTYKDFGYLDYEYMLLIQNGGDATWEDAIADPEVEKWMGIINSLPFYTDVINDSHTHIHLCHSGYLPANPGKMESHHVAHDILWDRRHYFYKWNKGVYGYDIVVHGHTPIPYIKDELENTYEEPWEFGAYWYCPDDEVILEHKCCIDNATYNTNIACLLDLNTFDEHIFRSSMKKYF